jgi:hypothetical protein
MDKATLEHLLSSYNWWMGISTIAVAVGILGEYIAHFVFEKEARKNSAAMVVSVVFGLAVLGGVVGEFLCGHKLSQVSDELQRMADKEVADANKVAESARSEVEAARKESSQNNERASKALEDAETARKEALKFQLQIAQANERAASAEKETAKLTQRFADRKLNATQLKAISDKIRPFAGQEYDVTPYWDLKESLAIANEIATGLNMGGWKYIAPKQSGFMMGGIAGVQVYVHPAAEGKIKSAASALVSALNDQGIEAVLKEQNPANPLDTKLHLNVGTKE